MQDTVNYVPRVAIYDIEGTIMGKPVRNSSAYDGLVQLFNYVIFFKVVFEEFFKGSLALSPVEIKDVNN